MAMNVRGVDFIYYEVSDIAKSKSFYGETLGFKVSSESEGQWIEFDLGNVTLGIGSYSQGGVGGSMAALAVESVPAALEELKAKGVPVTMGLEDFPGCSMAVITDPDGNKLMLHARKDGSCG